MRSGVAPDHPKIKSISRTFEKTAADPRFRFYGNVAVGIDVTADELSERYDAVVYAVGTQSDRALGIQRGPAGKRRRGGLRRLVQRPPAFRRDGTRHLQRTGGGDRQRQRRHRRGPHPGDRPRRAGQTDIADHALDALHKRGVSEVVIVGRRGPLQGAFTTLELRELGELEGVDVVVDPADLAGITDEDAAAAGKTVAANIKVLRGYAEKTAAGEHTPGHRRIVFRFHHPDRDHRLGKGGDNRAGTQRTRHRRARAPDRPGHRRTPDAARAAGGARVGYRGVAMPGLPFDERTGTIPHTEGKITGRANDYVVGWIKRGPSGVIGTNKKDWPTPSTP